MSKPVTTVRQVSRDTTVPPATTVVVVRLSVRTVDLPAWPELPLAGGTLGSLVSDNTSATWLLATPDGAPPDGLGQAEVETCRLDDVDARLQELAGPTTTVWRFDDVLPRPASLANPQTKLTPDQSNPVTVRCTDPSTYLETIELDDQQNVKAIRRSYGDAAEGPATRPVGAVWRGPSCPRTTGAPLVIDPSDIVPVPHTLADYLNLINDNLDDSRTWSLDDNWTSPRPGVHIHRTATVDPRALLVGPLVIGPHAKVDRCSLLGPAVIGPGATVGSFATVSASALSADAVVESRGYLCQSVLGRGATLATDKTLDYQVLDTRGRRTGTGQPPRLSGHADPRTPLWQRLSDASYRFVKRTIDIAGALVGLALTLPFYPLIALVIKLDNPGPVFFRHVRQSRGGRPFSCLKFRSMRTDAEKVKQQLRQANQCDGPQFHLERDPRLTRFGQWMRRRNIDELPQLINVLKGDMSLVGPRPSPDNENQLCPAWRRARLSVRPGITGLWQVCRRDRAGGDFHQWIYYDTEYVQHRGLALDIRILLATFKLVLLNWSEVGPDDGRTDATLPYGLRSVKPLVGWGLALGVAWLAAWWTTAGDLWHTWTTDADYSHGPLIPLIALGMVWYRRDLLKGVRIHPTWIGALLLGVAFACRFVGLYYWYGSLERLSMVLALAGVVVLVYGMDLFRRVFWPLAFLLLMFPLPRRIDQAIMGPLQTWGAKMGQWMIGLAGIEVTRLGNTLIVEGNPMEVARACSGLRLVYAFMALAFCVAYLSKRVAWEKVLIATSSLPIAVAINAFRIFAIAAVLSYSGWRWSIGDVHDAWNWVMMPLALLALLLETWILKKLFIDPEPRWSFNT